MQFWLFKLTIYYYCRDSKWTLNDHVKSLFSKYKCWRIVYWSLWSECHFMRCSRCQYMYPAKNQRCCQFHTQQPQYYPVENNRYLYYPIGNNYILYYDCNICTLLLKIIITPGIYLYIKLICKFLGRYPCCNEKTFKYEPIKNPFVSFHKGLKLL